MFFILFVLFDYTCDILCGGREPIGMQSIQLLLSFFLLRFVLASTFLGWLSLLAPCLPALCKCSACLEKKMHLNPLYLHPANCQNSVVFSPWLIPVSSASCLALSHFFLMLPLFLMFIFYGSTEASNLLSVNTSNSQQRTRVVFVLFGCWVDF